MVEFGYSLDIGKSIKADKKAEKKHAQDKEERKPVSTHAPKASDLAKKKGEPVSIIREPEDRVWGLRQFVIEDCDGYLISFSAELDADKQAVADG